MEKMKEVIIMETLKQSLVEEFNHWHEIALDECKGAEDRNHAHKKVMEQSLKLDELINKYYSVKKLKKAWIM